MCPRKQLGIWRRVTWYDNVQELWGAHPASDDHDFCATESSGVRSFKWWWRCSDRRLVAKIPMKIVSLLAMYSTFDGSEHTGTLIAMIEQYRRCLRQRKNARKDEDC